jgi:hypothetical protein
MGFIEQTVCTEPGEDYVLTFDLKTNGSASLVAVIDGNSQNFSSNGSYSSYTVAFTASSSATTIRLTTDGLYRYDQNNVFLDNVSIACGDVDPPVDGGCETAFAYGGPNAISFYDLVAQGMVELDNPKRWGWSNGPLSEGSYSFAIYAGAGQNDLSKGTLVGQLDVEYTLHPFTNAGTAYVTYVMDTGYTMNEIHLNVGSDILATKDGDYTLAPGQYDITADGLGGVVTYSAQISNLSGPIYVVAHAVVCGDGLGD